jgi:hypothetical protein
MGNIHTFGNYIWTITKLSSHELQSALMLTVEFLKMYYTR